MTEREKMLAGELYDANFDPELLQQRLEAEDLTWELNALRPGDPRRQMLLEKIMGELSEGVTVLAPVYFDYGPMTKLGAGTFVNHGCYFMDGGTVHIGENVFIGPFCGFYTASHPLNYAERNTGLEKALPIVVGDNCWFGANVSVLQGVTIGSGCVVAAGSVVTEDIPENCLVAGVPATIKKRLNL
jgi:acetyltransferase-like isoleucine patch superfamily enzyme